MLKSNSRNTNLARGSVFSAEHTSKLFNTNLKQIAQADLKMYENVWDEISTNK